MGDTLDSCEFQVKVNGEPLNLENADINMQVREESKRGTVRLELNLDNGGISFVDAVAGKFIRNKVDAVVPRATEYYYDIQIDFGNKNIKTYLAGNWNITDSPISFFHFPDHLRGDTYGGYTFTGFPVDLLNVFLIKMEIRHGGYGGDVVKELLSTNNAFDIIDGSTLRVLPFVADLERAGMYYYKIRSTMNNGDKKTYVGGKWHIIDDVTRL